MSTYIVTFEVDDVDRKDRLKSRLKTYEYYCPINDNCWAIITDQTPAQIRDYLGEPLDGFDRIFVIRSGTYAAWRNVYGEKNSEWLKENL